uniref:Uncharacterized protein n=1 Tax=Psilocybe cubensis TaxID=181762 RepID=A0A8H7XUH8_PSICU
MKLFKRKSTKGDVVAEVMGISPGAVGSANDATKPKKKKGKARRVFLGILKKTVPCASGRAHTVENVGEDESFYDQKHKSEVTATGEFIFEPMGLPAQSVAVPIAAPAPAHVAGRRNRQAQIIQPKVQAPAAMGEVNGSVDIVQEARERTERVVPEAMNPANANAGGNRNRTARVIQPKIQDGSVDKFSIIERAYLHQLKTQGDRPPPSDAQNKAKRQARIMYPGAINPDHKPGAVKAADVEKEVSTRPKIPLPPMPIDPTFDPNARSEVRIAHPFVYPPRPPPKPLVEHDASSPPNIPLPPVPTYPYDRKFRRQARIAQPKAVDAPAEVADAPVVKVEEPVKPVVVESSTTPEAVDVVEVAEVAPANTVQKSRRHARIVQPIVFAPDNEPAAVDDLDNGKDAAVATNVLEVAEVDTANVAQRKRRHARFVLPVDYIPACEAATGVEVEDVVKPAVVEEPVGVEEPAVVVVEEPVVEEPVAVEEPVVEEPVVEEPVVVEESAVVDVQSKVVDHVEVDEERRKRAYTSFDAVLVGLSLLRDDSSEGESYKERDFFSDESSHPGDVEDVVSEVAAAVENEVAVRCSLEVRVAVTSKVVAYGTILFDENNNNTVSEVASFEDDLIVLGSFSKDADFKVCTFGSIPLLEDDTTADVLWLLVGNFIKTQYLTRRVAVGKTSEVVGSSVVDSSTVSEVVDRSSNGDLSPLVDSIPSEYSSSPTTPVEVQQAGDLPKEEVKEEVKEIVDVIEEVPVLGSPIKLVTSSPKLAVVPTSLPYAKGVPTRRVDIRGTRQRVQCEGTSTSTGEQPGVLVRSILNLEEAYSTTNKPRIASASPVVETDAPLSTTRKVPPSRIPVLASRREALARRRFGTLYESRSTPAPGIRPLLLPLHKSNRDAYDSEHER